MSLFWIAQAVGACAVVLSLGAFQTNKRLAFLRLSALASIFYMVQFVMLGAHTGAGMNAVAGARYYTFYKLKPAKNNRKVLLLFMTLGVGAAALTWQGPISFFALGGNLLNATASWQQNIKLMRRIALMAPVLWIIYNVSAHSYPGILIQALIFCSNIIGQYRFDYKMKIKTTDGES